MHAPAQRVYYLFQKERGKVGDITKEFIQKNREILEEEKQKAKEDVYDPP